MTSHVVSRVLIGWDRAGGLTTLAEHTSVRPLWCQGPLSTNQRAMTPRMTSSGHVPPATLTPQGLWPRLTRCSPFFCCAHIINCEPLVSDTADRGGEEMIIK